jgi:hypothetical protein
MVWTNTAQCVGASKLSRRGAFGQHRSGVGTATSSRPAGSFPRRKDPRRLEQVLPCLLTNDQDTLAVPASTSRVPIVGPKWR